MDRGSPGSQRYRKKTRKFTEDVLISLPKNIIDAILIRLPLRDAVRTSILSHAWRFAWTDISEIVIDRANFPRYESRSVMEYDSKIVSIVDQVFLLHQGPIHKFELSVDFRNCKHIDRWILFLSRNGTKKITIIPSFVERFEVPSCLFSCEGITHLTLSYCRLVLPALFNGFNNIKTLVLQNISCSEYDLHVLISSCPLLNRLTLEGVHGVKQLYLSAQNLVTFSVDCSLGDIYLVETPVVADICITYFIRDQYLKVAKGTTCELVKILGCLPSISRMTLNCAALQVLSAGNIPSKLPTTSELLYWCADINFDDVQQMLAALCVFRNSPHLQKVHLSAYSDENNMVMLSTEDFWKAQEYFNGLFCELKTLIVSCFSGTDTELRFVELVLSSAPVLQMVQIEPREPIDDGYNISRKLNRFRRLSSKVEVDITE